VSCISAYRQRSGGPAKSVRERLQAAYEREITKRKAG
jgi:hypothetical protein